MSTPDLVRKVEKPDGTVWASIYGGETYALHPSSGLPYISGYEWSIKKSSTDIFKLTLNQVFESSTLWGRIWHGAKAPKTRRFLQKVDQFPLDEDENGLISEYEILCTALLLLGKIDKDIQKRKSLAINLQLVGNYPPKHIGTPSI